ncbi:MAG TPA: hypothetical protein VGR25_09105 [bacterium]|jgi:uncharacterized protein involved in exopolysaccharide biosynthesis|nr:hypothetical protein [bacterium]
MGGQGFEFRHYYRAIVRRLWLVGLLAVLIAGGVYWRTSSQAPRYRAATTILVTAPVLQPPTSTAGTTQQSSSSGGRSTQILMGDITHLLTTRPVAERVTGTLGLRLNTFWDSVAIEDVRGTNLLKIRASSTDRTMPARLANTTAEQFIAYFRDVNRRDMREVRTFVGKELAKTRAALEASDRQIQGYKERHQFLDLNTFIGSMSTGLETVRNDRATALVQLRETQARLAASTARLSRESLTRVGQRDLENNPVFTGLESRLTALEVQKAELSQRYTPLHPRMQTLEGEIASIRQQIKAQAQYRLGRQVQETNPIHDQMLTSIANLEVERAATTARLAALSSVERTRAAALLPLAGQQRELNALLRENTILSQSYSLLADRYQEALLRESEAGFMPAGVQVVERATTPSQPVSAGLPIRVGLGVLLGLLLGAMAAIVLETGDDRIRTPQDAERALGVPVLVGVPDMSPQRTAPGGAVLVIGFILFLLVSSSFLVARTGAELMTTSNNPVASVLAHLGRGIDGLTAWVGQAIR